MRPSLPLPPSQQRPDGLQWKSSPRSSPLQNLQRWHVCTVNCALCTEDARATGRKDAIPRATVTPGTPFMRAMEDAVMEFAQQTLERSPHLEIVVSGCSVPVRSHPARACVTRVSTFGVAAHLTVSTAVVSFALYGRRAAAAVCYASKRPTRAPRGYRARQRSR